MTLEELEAENVICKSMFHALFAQCEDAYNKLKEIEKWPEPDPKAGQGGPGPLYTAGVLDQYGYDRALHSKQISEAIDIFKVIINDHLDKSSQQV